MEKVAVWEKQVMFYMADSALWTENESSEYLNHITSINTHKTPKLRKPLLWNKFDNGWQKNKGTASKNPVPAQLCCMSQPAEPSENWSLLQLQCPSHSRALQSLTTPNASETKRQTLLYLLELLHFSSDMKFLKQRNYPLKSTRQSAHYSWVAYP